MTDAGQNRLSSPRGKRASFQRDPHLSISRMGTCPIFRQPTVYYTPAPTPTKMYSSPCSRSLTPPHPRNCHSHNYPTSLSESHSEFEDFQDAQCCFVQQHMAAHTHTHKIGPISLIETHSVTLTHNHHTDEPVPISGSRVENRCQLQLPQLSPIASRCNSPDHSPRGECQANSQPQSVTYRHPFTCSLTHSPTHRNVLVHAYSF